MRGLEMNQANIRQVLIAASFAFSLGLGVPDISFSETEMSGEFRSLKALQTDLHRLPPDKQERLQPKVRQAELQACQKLREERRKGVRPETYQQEGGAELLAFVQQFDHYCQMLQ
jgi:hypothetical protein